MFCVLQLMYPYKLYAKDESVSRDAARGDETRHWRQRVWPTSSNNREHHKSQNEKLGGVWLSVKSWFVFTACMFVQQTRIDNNRTLAGGPCCSDRRCHCCYAWVLSFHPTARRYYLYSYHIIDSIGLRVKMNIVDGGTPLAPLYHTPAPISKHGNSFTLYIRAYIRSSYSLKKPFCKACRCNVQYAM